MEEPGGTRGRRAWAARGLGGVLAASRGPLRLAAASPRVPKYGDAWADGSAEERNLSRAERGGLPA